MNTNNRIDKIAKNVFSNDSMESVNQDFTDSIMSKIMASKASAPVIVEPIFSQKAWYIITAVISAVILFSLAYIPASNNFTTYTSFTYYDIQSIILPNINLSQIDISTTTYYSIVVVGFLFIIQLIVIDKRYQP